MEMGVGGLPFDPLRAAEHTDSLAFQGGWGVGVGTWGPVPCPRSCPYGMSLGQLPPYNGRLDGL